MCGEGQDVRSGALGFLDYYADPLQRFVASTHAMGLGTHIVEKFSACSQAVTSSGLELSRSIGA